MLEDEDEGLPPHPSPPAQLAAVDRLFVMVLASLWPPTCCFAVVSLSVLL